MRDKYRNRYNLSNIVEKLNWKVDKIVRDISNINISYDDTGIRQLITNLTDYVNNNLYNLLLDTIFKVEQVEDNTSNLHDLFVNKNSNDYIIGNWTFANTSPGSYPIRIMSKSGSSNNFPGSIENVNNRLTFSTINNKEILAFQSEIYEKKLNTPYYVNNNNNSLDRALNSTPYNLIQDVLFNKRGSYNFYLKNNFYYNCTGEQVLNKVIFWFLLRSNGGTSVQFQDSKDTYTNTLTEDTQGYFIEKERPVVRLVLTKSFLDNMSNTNFMIDEVVKILLNHHNNTMESSYPQYTLINNNFIDIELSYNGSTLNVNTDIKKLNVKYMVDSGGVKPNFKNKNFNIVRKIKYELLPGKDFSKTTYKFEFNNLGNTITYLE